MMNDEIVDVPGYQGYKVDRNGNVYSCWVNKGIHGLMMGDTPKKLKGSKTKHGHIFVRFSGRSGKHVYVHRIVYEVFNGPIPDGLMVRHKNDIPNDNRLENLCLGTQKDNMADCKELGNFPIGIDNGQSKLTEKDVRFIKEMKGVISQEKLAKQFGVTRRTIGFIHKNLTWKHVKMEEIS